MNPKENGKNTKIKIKQSLVPDFGRRKEKYNYKDVCPEKTIKVVDNLHVFTKKGKVLLLTCGEGLYR